MSSKKIIISVLVVSALLGAGVYLGSRLTQSVPGPLVTVPESTSSPSGLADYAQSTSSPTVRIMGGAMYAHDYSIDKYLMGVSHNVFVAKVTKQLGEKLRDGTPCTRVEGEVIFNVKGHLSGTVVIEQIGGHLKEVLYVPYEDFLRRTDTDKTGYFLGLGATYLIATRFDQAENLYAVGTVPSAVKLLSDDGSLSNAQLQALAINDIRVKQLEAAYPNEDLDSSDVYNKTAWNSFQSLSFEEKNAALTRAGLPTIPAPTSTPTSTGN